MKGTTDIDSGPDHLVPFPDSAACDMVRAADDFGHIVGTRPLGVLTPASVAELRGFVTSAAAHGLPVAARGGGYSVYGQGQAEGGYVVDLSALDEVRCAPAARTLTAGAGARWSEVVRAALAEGLSPPVLPDHLGGSVGGLLSTGGLGGSSHRHGLVADHVRELDVVTGAGAEVTCSRERHPDLFDAVVAGLGQCALIVRATLDLVPAPTLVRRFRLYHHSPGTFFADQRALARDDRFSHVCGQARPALGGAWDYMIEAVAPCAGRLPCDDTLLTGGLGHDRETEEIENLSYEEFLRRIDRDERILRTTGEWQRPHPWLTLLLPEEAAPSFVPTVLADHAQRGLRACGAVQLRPLTSRTLRAPLLRRPPGELLCLLSLMRTAPPGAPENVREAVAANRALYERARALGGVLHPTSALPMTSGDWRAHFGPVWETLARAKDRYDPRSVLTRGYGLWP
ncbi:FAD-binding protein [Streptomyces turgidiscabies]|uniref:FAD binding domain protein n=1 Tax=Streptomyces turgidiscabies (strain Car8) TaxID=698760 RepID=L7FHY8_STRT8|nr:MULTISPECIES: FAD-binding protein [Streptomyces]ELP71003.1 FAD binding domain protein [Streptomyces turgidiscabies Car8]MDX3491874.1 FAD-binding protein [Streptomyces turgidiscabies]GAQ72009.1 putative oxidoreductase ORF5 in fasciation locus [Streptomyces turgidiscabies]